MEIIFQAQRETGKKEININRIWLRQKQYLVAKIVAISLPNGWVDVRIAAVGILLWKRIMLRLQAR